VVKYKNRSTKGKEGESLTVQFLEKKGFNIISRNFRCKTGEIDLIAMDREDLVFIEVKNWPAFGQENLAYGINRRKQRRIIETAKYFLSLHRKYNYRPVRFDIVYIRPDEPMLHLTSAFTET